MGAMTGCEGERMGIEEAAIDAARVRDRGVLPEVRRRHGVVHTPLPIARYIVRCASEALRDVGVELTAPGVRIVDPACGPGIFLATAMAAGAPGGSLLGVDRDPVAIRQAREVLGAGPELMTADTLSLPPERLAGGPVLLVGNPPWAGRTVAPDESDALLADFRASVREERKIGVLSDAYIRFLRWGAEVVRLAPRGVLAMVTNASYLDGPVHRGMRAWLRAEFDRVALTDLGGSALVAKGRGADANLFGVRPGAVVLVASRGARRAPITYVRVRGDMRAKFAALEAGPPKEELVSRPPHHLFVPNAGPGFPSDWVGLDELFPFHREGVQTNRDAVVVASRREVLAERLHAFALGLRRPDLERAWTAKPHYDPERARRAVANALACDPEGRELIEPLAYRPFQKSYFAPISPLCHRPRPRLRQAVAHSSRVLLSIRKDRGDRPWAHVAVTRATPDNCFFSSRSSCRTRAFPTHDPQGDANLSELAAAWADQLGGPRHLFDYVLGHLGSSRYQARYDGALRIDYPRVAPPRAYAGKLAAAGAALSAAHLSTPTDAQTLVGHRSVRSPEGISEAQARCDAAFATLDR